MWLFLKSVFPSVSEASVGNVPAQSGDTVARRDTQSPTVGSWWGQDRNPNSLVWGLSRAPCPVLHQMLAGGWHCWG